MSSGGRVLSIQSHVVRGYVGNKCSVFPLQLLGFDVDPINSVHFSNHTGYATFEGTVLQGEELTHLLHGLESNGLLGGYTHMLTGYIGSPSFLRAVIDVHRRLKIANPGMLFICDPVLGDEGRLYVPAENASIYREEVLPLATMITPNQYEAELLSGVTIHTEEDAVRACMALHARGPETVVITSSRLGGGAIGATGRVAGPNGDRDDIVLLASTRRRRRAHHGDTPLPSGVQQQSQAVLSTGPPPQTGAEAAEAESGAGVVGGGRGGGCSCRAGGGDSGGGGGGGNVNGHGHRQRAVAGNNGGDAGAGGGWQGLGLGAQDIFGAGAEAAGAEAAGGGVDRVVAGGGDGGGGEGAGAGEADPGSDEGFDVYRMTFPRLPQHFTGTGDLAAALLLAWTHRLPGNLAGALERVAGSVRAVLTRTHHQGSTELLLVQSKADIERPPLDIRAATVVTGH